MRRGWKRIGLPLLAAVLAASALAGCSRAAPERKAVATEPQAIEAAEALPVESLPTPAQGETSVAVLPVAPTSPAADAPAPSASTAVVAVQVSPAPTLTAEPVEEPAPTEAAAAAEAVQPTAGTTAEPSSPTGKTITHTVQRGETLSGIAQRYGTTVAAIIAANNIKNPSLIYSGQKLNIPTSGTAAASAPQTTSRPASSGCRYHHTVKRGEWIWQIARNYGVSPYAVLSANGLTVQTGRVITAGKVLCIP
jgi:N-acetylmuramoyl-L-alanine amidase